MGNRLFLGLYALKIIIRKGALSPKERSIQNYFYSRLNQCGCEVMGMLMLLWSASTNVRSYPDRQWRLCVPWWRPGWLEADDFSVARAAWISATAIG